MATIEAFAPAKINLTLHVTGQRADGYHLLDSIVAFADVGDHLRVTLADEMSLTVTGLCANGVPADARNLCWQAAERFGRPVSIELHKNLPAAAGIGGGSSDAAAVIRALEELTGQATTFDPLNLGADVPVCLYGRSARLQGVGEEVQPFGISPLQAVLVNPGVEVATGRVFAGLADKENAPMTDPTADDFVEWLGFQRNDLEAPALAVAPEIGEILCDLRAADGCRLARMSGSGATCFGLFETRQEAVAVAEALKSDPAVRWVTACMVS